MGRAKLAWPTEPAAEPLRTAPFQSPEQKNACTKNLPGPCEEERTHAHPCLILLPCLRSQAACLGPVRRPVVRLPAVRRGGGGTTPGARGRGPFAGHGRGAPVADGAFPIKQGLPMATRQKA